MTIHQGPWQQPTTTQPPNGGDGMEARVAKLEAHAEHVQSDLTDIKRDISDIRKDITKIRTTDFRLIFGAIIATALGLAWIMAKGFHWI